MDSKVIVDRKAEKQLLKVPRYIQIKFWLWVQEVELQGLIKIRKQPGYHDEPLKGDRLGQRSVRLNKQYRAVYVEIDGIATVKVIEVNAHDY